MARLFFLQKYSTINIILASCVLIVVSFLFGFVAIPKAITYKLDTLNLKPGSMIRGVWEKAPIPITFSFYIFNITNTNDVLQGKKPKLQQVGPYVFDKWISKDILAESEEDDTVTFNMINVFDFREDLSNGLTGDEVVTVPHLLALGGMIAMQRDNPGLVSIVTKAMMQIFEPTSPFVSFKVMDVLFNGIGINCDRSELEASIVCPELKGISIMNVVNDTFYEFSLFGKQNATSSGTYKVYRGIKDYRNNAKLLSIDGNNKSTKYPGACSEMIGTDGTIFYTRMKHEPLKAYVPLFCRTITLTPIDKSYDNGIPTSVFSLNFDDLKKNPRDHCFCQDQDVKKCPPKGTYDLFSCHGMPLYASSPHFLNTDESLLKAVEGLKPNKTLHGTRLHFELQTGTAITVYNRAQFSFQFEKIEGFNLSKEMKPVIIPVFWIEESILLNTSFTNQIKYALHYGTIITNTISLTGIFCGFIGLIFVAYNRFESKYNKISPPTTAFVKSAFNPNGNDEGRKF